MEKENEKKYILIVTAENTECEKGLVSLPIRLNLSVIMYKMNHIQYLYISSDDGWDTVELPSYLYKDGYELLTLTEWASNYWNGKDDAYKLTEISILKVR